ncbi:MAG: hypothetical protein HRU38_23600 [Saccharospirillaceae bacterium]|nr:hypothetical protein [Flavobacteriales bacterium]NRB81607.1 hypothetical protein [Saccharospirillaceae bacterium]
MGNAVKFTNEGEITVLAFLEGHKDDKVSIKIEVIDTGEGISEENQLKLFSEFQQLDHSSTKEAEGTGLGLAICKQLVHLMNGEIGVISDGKNGSTFWFTFDAMPVKAIIPKLKDENITQVEESFNANVLIVDDNDINLTVARLMLIILGCTVDIAEDGQKALDKFKEKQIRLDIYGYSNANNGRHTIYQCH